jgi:hypothetical protein
MKLSIVFCSALVLGGCSSTSSGGNGETNGDASNDTSTTTPDSASPEETGTDAHPDTGTPSDAGTDSPTEGGGDGGSDAADGSLSCPSSWMVAPGVPAALALPDGGVVILHAAGAGTQNYACTAFVVDGGSGEAGATGTWTLTGPTATLSDCNSVVIGHHFASEAGASAPEWMETVDGTYVIGHKVAAFAPDGGPPGSVPWLLLQATSHGGTGTLSNTTYIQRLNTDGGAAPPSCDPGDASTLQVPYSADYYFFGP